MQIIATRRRRVIVAAAILACATILTGALSPAVSDEVRPFLQALGIISCTSGSPCEEGKNAGKGAGLEGISAKGKGVIGQTTFNSTSSSNGQAGVLGQDLSTTGTNDVGVQGISTNGIGVFGQSASNLGVLGSSTSTAGVYGTSTNDRGIVGTGPLYGAEGFSAGGAGVFGQSTTGTGVLGKSANASGVTVIGGSSSSPFLPALSVFSTSTANEDLIEACEGQGTTRCSFSSPLFAVAYDGSVFTNDLVANYAISVQTFNTPSGSIDITGQYEKNGLCVSGCGAPTETAPGRGVVTYTQMVGQPTIEDFGETQLVAGQAFVRLDPKFANVIEQKASYLVFITPEGDANTLYVTDKKIGGFTVRESHGGRSTLMFSYRIVARPFGAHEARLPMAELPSLHARSPNRARLFHPHP